MSEKVPASRVNPIPPAARPLQGLRAGVISRCIAGGIDYAVIVTTTLGSYLALIVLRFLIDPRSFNDLPTIPAYVWLIVGFALMVLYLWVCFASTGRTLGDRVMGLRVVGRTGSRMAWWGAFVRAVFCTVFPIGLFWCAVSRENRSFQDVVLRTSVIHHWPVPPQITDIADVERRSAL